MVLAPLGVFWCRLSTVKVILEFINRFTFATSNCNNGIVSSEPQVPIPHKSMFLLRKIALPYPHKCLFGFVEQNVSTDKNFLRNILVTRGDPFVCACPRLRSSRCRQTIVESSSLYFWSIWEQHVFFLIIVHSRMKIYEVLKHASVHLPVVVHYSTGTTTISASLVLKRVRIRCARRCCCKVFSGRRVYLPLYSPIIRLELPPCR